MKDRLWDINHGFEWPEPDEAKVSSPVPRGVGLSDGPRLPDHKASGGPPCCHLLMRKRKNYTFPEAFCPHFPVKSRQVELETNQAVFLQKVHVFVGLVMH